MEWPRAPTVPRRPSNATRSPVRGAHVQRAELRGQHYPLRATSGSRAWPPERSWSARCLRHLEGHDESNYLPGDQLCGRDRPRQRDNEYLGPPFRTPPRCLTKMVNDAAVAAGTTVDQSSTGSGVTNTSASPASDPRVIAVGRLHQFRSYAQTKLRGRPSISPHRAGWPTTSERSAKAALRPRTGPSPGAPGDLVSPRAAPTAIYQGASSMRGNPSPAS